MSKAKATALELLKLSEAFTHLKDRLDGLSDAEEDLLFETIKEIGDASLNHRAGALNKGAITICGLAYSIQRSDPAKWPDKVVEKRVQASPFADLPTKDIIKEVTDRTDLDERDLPSASRFSFNRNK